MKKPLKIVGISLLSLLGIVLIAGVIIVYIIFTPARITPIVREQIEKQLSCQVEVDEVELTFFSTFPQIGLHTKNLLLRNPMHGAPSDTLVYLSAVTATLDIGALLNDNAIILKTFDIESGSANIYIDSLGIANYDIFETDTTIQDTTDFVMPFDEIELGDISIAQLRLSYVDEKSKMSASVADLNLELDADLIDTDGNADGTLALNKVTFMINDSAPLFVDLSKAILKFDGSKKSNLIAGDIQFHTPDILLVASADTLLNDYDIAIDAPFELQWDSMSLNLKEALLAIQDHEIELSGAIQLKENSDISMGLNFATTPWQLKKVLALIPPNYTQPFKDLTVDGDILLSGTVIGTYNDSLMPLIMADIELNKGTMKYASLPYHFHSIAGKLGVNIDLNTEQLSSIQIEKLFLKTKNTSASLSGSINDFMNTMLLDFRVNADLDLGDAAPLLPEQMNIALKGRAKGNLHTQCTLDELSEVMLERIKLTGSIALSDFKMIYEDSLIIQSPKAFMDLKLASNNINKTFKEVIQANINADKIHIEMIDMLTAELATSQLKISLSDLMDDKTPLSVACAFDVNRLDGAMDTITLQANQPKGTFTMTPSSKNSNNTNYIFDLKMNSLDAKMGDFAHFDAQATSLAGEATYDSLKSNIILQWDPHVQFNVQNGQLKINDLDSPVKLPYIVANFSPDRLVINKSRFVLDSSDFNLSGVVTNIDEYLDHSGLLTADLNFISEKTNIGQLMDLFNGFGATDSTHIATLEEPAQSGDSEPFMVPWGVDIIFRTQIKNAILGETEIQNIGGTLKVRDGVLVLEQMGFTCNAAKMQLTAIYRSSRKNHLFGGIDFHLLDIEIDQLLAMIPAIDTVVPMLKWFNGRAEFHMTGEVYFKSNYDIKWSTLRGAASINGNQLTVLDSETFKKISKTLLFSKKTKNVIDNLNVEMTVFRNEVDLYPFFISMDKYQAIIAARYDLSDNYNAHIEAIKPIRLGIDITGNLNSSLKFKPFSGVKYYDALYKPQNKNVVQQETLRLKKIISDALKANVKEQQKTEDVPMEYTE